jgi:hypothetical protein
MLVFYKKFLLNKRTKIIINREKMTLENNLKYAREAIIYTKNCLSFGASNTVKEHDSYPAKLEADRRIKRARKRLRKFSFFTDPHITSIQKTRLHADCAKLHEAGNCDEQSSVAYIYLTDVKHLRKVDRVQITGIDHVFLVIGRRDGSNINDYTTWGNEAVICDPWGNRYFPVKYLQYHLNNILTSNSFAQFNSETNPLTDRFNENPIRDEIDNIILKKLEKNTLKRIERKENAKQILNIRPVDIKKSYIKFNTEINEYIEINSLKKRPPTLLEQHERTISYQYTQYMKNLKKDETYNILSINSERGAKTFLGVGMLNQTLNFFKNTTTTRKVIARKYTVPFLGLATGLHCFSLLFKKKAELASNEARDIWHTQATKQAPHKDMREENNQLLYKYFP